MIYEYMNNVQVYVFVLLCVPTLMSAAAIFSFEFAAVVPKFRLVPSVYWILFNLFIYVNEPFFSTEGPKFVFSVLPLDSPGRDV